jgi:hypothetical protein
MSQCMYMCQARDISLWQVATTYGIHGLLGLNRTTTKGYLIVGIKNFTAQLDLASNG